MKFIIQNPDKLISWIQSDSAFLNRYQSGNPLQSGNVTVSLQKKVAQARLHRLQKTDIIKCMRRFDRQYQLMRRRKRQQRRLGLCMFAALLISILLWNSAHSVPRNEWLKIPEGFYQPDFVSDMAAFSDISLQPLPEKFEDAGLRQKIEQELAQYPQHFKPHLYYLNLQDYSYVNINGDDAVPAASVIKLPILLAYFRQIDQGKMTPFTHLMYEDYVQASGSGYLQYQPTGQPLLAKDVATMMIQSSDNTCTNMLIYNLGGSADLNHYFAEMGLNRTRIQNWLPDLTGTNVISMQDMAKVLYNLKQGDVLSTESHSAASEILRGTHNRRLLPALLPPEVMIEHKTGDIGTSLGNSGLITLPDGQRYIIAMQVERPFNDYTARDIIQRVSRVVYDDVRSKTALAAGGQSSKAL